MSVSFDRVSTIYDATRGLPPEVSEQVTDCILRLTAATPKTHFFEPGIGTGRIALPLVQRGYAYTGIDISDEMMDVLRRKLEGVPHQLTLIKGDATALPFDDRTFDVALTVHLLHLVANWQNVLSEIRRVLKPEGIFLYVHGRGNDAKPGDFDFNQPQHEFKQRWDEILADHGVQLKDYGATEADVLEDLAQQGATVETIVAAEWRIEQTIGELLHRYQNRMYSSSWQIPNDIFAAAIQTLTAWCEQHYPSLDLDVSHNARFKLAIARQWSR
ncbi:MAG: class I SAM-dependent methyltransferase [Lyngbya sp. HA4199-MV5]|jgi:ubiquinone/menaquinone biosynthesis C-methylase UbiE|nr:class I SAM-dependent methyltransferase [Lyngbya sp. HA4199-MV5]